MSKLIVAFPKFEDGIAPCFEAANHFLIAVIADREVISAEIISCSGCEGFGRVRLLHQRGVNLVVCDGIKSFYRDLLVASGMGVVANVAVPVGEAVSLVARGELVAEVIKPQHTELGPELPLEDLICWTRELFESHGYKTTPGAERAPFPIDLVAEITCPICDRPVRVAICCGAHTYRADQELREFHRVSATAYHAQVYVRPATADVARCCHDYGIELVDPGLDTGAACPARKSRIPLLHGPIAGHERATARGRDGERR